MCGDEAKPQQGQKPLPAAGTRAENQPKPQRLQDASLRSSVQVAVPAEEVVEDAQRGLQVAVHDVWTGGRRRGRCSAAALCPPLTPPPPLKRVLPSGRGFGLSKPPSCMSSNAKDTLWTCGEERGTVTLTECVGWWEGEAEDGRGLLPPPHPPTHTLPPPLTFPWNSARDGRKKTRLSDPVQSK